MKHIVIIIIIVIAVVLLIPIDSFAVTTYTYRDVDYTILGHDLILDGKYQNMIRLKLSISGHQLTDSETATAYPMRIVLEDQFGQHYDPAQSVHVFLTECQRYGGLTIPNQFTVSSKASYPLDICYVVSPQSEKFGIYFKLGAMNTFENLDYVGNIDLKRDMGFSNPLNAITNWFKSIPQIFYDVISGTIPCPPLCLHLPPTPTPAISVPNHSSQVNPSSLPYVTPRPTNEPITSTFFKEGGISSDGWKQKRLGETTKIKSNSDGTIKFQYFVPVDHCADVNVHVLLDGEEVKDTGFMGNYNVNKNIPLESGKITLDVEPDKNYSITFYPEGRPNKIPDGCGGEGYVISWGGIIKFYP